MADEIQWLSTREKGNDLEARVAAYFQSLGYSVRTNQVVTGRSGGRHEIDVLAVKQDGILELRVMAECKYHSAPVSKDIVAKVKLVRDDCLVDKAVIVCPAGFILGAAQQAEEHGIELWEGPASTVVTAPATQSGSLVTGDALIRSSNRKRAIEAIQGSRQGILKKEEVVGIAEAYLECFAVTVAYVARPNAKKPSYSFEEIVVFDGIEGTPLFTLERAAETTAGTTSAVLAATNEGQAVIAGLRKLILSTSTATPGQREKIGQQLATIGFRDDVESLSVVAVTRVLVPVVFGVLKSTGRERSIGWIDVDSTNAWLTAASSRLSDVLTRKLRLARPMLDRSNMG